MVLRQERLRKSWVIQLRGRPERLPSFRGLEMGLRAVISLHLSLVSTGEPSPRMQTLVSTKCQFGLLWSLPGNESLGICAKVSRLG